MTLELVVVGLGKRVKECALPAIAAAGEAVTVRSVFARTAREEQVAGRTLAVRALDTLTREDLAGGPTVYVCVPKTAIPPCWSAWRPWTPAAATCSSTRPS